MGSDEHVRVARKGLVLMYVLGFVEEAKTRLSSATPSPCLAQASGSGGDCANCLHPHWRRTKSLQQYPEQELFSSLGVLVFGGFADPKLFPYPGAFLH